LVKHSLERKQGQDKTWQNGLYQPRFTPREIELSKNRTGGEIDTTGSSGFCVLFFQPLIKKSKLQGTQKPDEP
jgi:hypothetical protein